MFRSGDVPAPAVAAVRPLAEPDLIADHPLFRGLSRARLEGLVGPLRPRALAAGRVLPRPAGPETEVHLILQGLLRAFELAPDGREAMVELIGPGGLDGFVSAPGRPARIIQALEDSVVLSFEQEQLDALTTEPEIAARLTHLLLGMLKYREDQLRLTAVREPARRLAFLLLMLAERFGQLLDDNTLIDCRLTHQMLADMLGFRRETVTHALHQLTNNHGVRSVSGRLLVNPRRLRRLAGPPVGPVAGVDSGSVSRVYP